MTDEKALGILQVTTTEQHQRFSSKTPSFNELFGSSGTRNVVPTLGNFKLEIRFWASEGQVALAS